MFSGKGAIPVRKLTTASFLTVMLASFSPSGAHEIHDAARRGDAAKVKSLLEKDGSIVDLRDESQYMNTPLHLAAAAGSERVVALLLASGADANARAATGETALYYAVRHGKTASVEVLLRGGAETNVRIQDGLTPLHLAAAVNQPDIAMMLIGRGASVNEAKRHGVTPLHIAAVFGFGSMAEMLVDNGAGIFMKSSDNSTPLHFAAAGARDDLVAFFFHKGMKLEGVRYPVYSGAFLGTAKPSAKPEVFLPEAIMSIYRPYGSVAASPDGKEIYWTRSSPDPGRYESIWYMKEENGRWTPPQIAPFAIEYSSNHPAFSPDGRRLYFGSDRPAGPEAQRGGLDIWFVEKTEKGWGAPVNMGLLDGIRNADAEHASVSSDGTVYFHLAAMTDRGIEADIFSSRPETGGYSVPVKLPEQVNTGDVEAGPCVAPDGSYIVFASDRRHGENAGFDIMVSFRSGDGGWSPAISASPVLDPGMRQCAGISADGKHVFFIGVRDGVWDYYWADSSIIAKLRDR